MITDYRQAVEYLYSNLPMFQRIGAAALKKDLANTIALCDALGNPQDKFKSIHVAGTNGKGSTAHMLAAILQSAGYKTGLYTSPHLKEFTERIRLNGKNIEEAFIVDFVNKVRPLIERIRPSFFEITVAMAFDYFASRQVDVAAIEVGLGGRLDSTNVIHPVLSIITNIGRDHADILGDTLEKIAAEKGGIIKPEVPVVISERQPVIEDVFIKIARDKHAPIFFASDHYIVSRDERGLTIIKDRTLFEDGVRCSLTGGYQLKNMAGVFMAVDQLRATGFDIGDDAVRTGLEKVTELTGLKGRWQKLRDAPLMICDTGHNAEGIREVMEQIRSLNFRQAHFVIGVVKDKAIDHVLELFPKQAHYYFCQANIPRALEADVLEEKANAYGLQGIVVKDVNEAIKKALEKASPDDLIFIGGSTFVVAEIANL